MSFASTYIDRNILFPQLIDEAPDENTAIIVIVPSYGETSIPRLLESILHAGEPACGVEVIIVVNAPENASPESIRNNRQTLSDITNWKIQTKNSWFRLFSVDIAPGSVKRWGVGLARKTGMDEAIRRFSKVEEPDGIIACLDADCTVRENYFIKLCDEFFRKKNRSACSIYFEHETEGDEFSKEVYSSIVRYELHLRYLLQGYRYSGFPWSFHTVGSSMAVKAGEYVRAGGMNRRQAGEDFYFIQKLVSSGSYFNLGSTTVFPSPRQSFRVPFGTGAAIGKMMEGSYNDYFTYNILAFDELKQFFGKTEELFNEHDSFEKKHKTLPEGIRSYLSVQEWEEKMNEIHKNTAGLNSFRKRFFLWFNMFRIVRYLNTVHNGLYKRIPVKEAATELLERTGIKTDTGSEIGILNIYRELERNN